MRYRNDTPYFRQAGDAMVAPGELSPDLDQPPLGERWTPVLTNPAPVERATPPVTADTPSVPAEQEFTGGTKGRKRVSENSHHGLSAS